MFSKLKQFVGMVGVTVQLEIPGFIPSDARVLEGIVRISATQDQHITSVRVTMTQQQMRSRSHHDNHHRHEYVIGETLLDQQPFDIKAGDVQEFPFTLNIESRSLLADALEGEDGILGALGQISQVMTDVLNEYWVKAVADVKGAALDPSYTKQIKFD